MTESAVCLFLGGSGGGTFPAPCNCDDPSLISTSGSASPSPLPTAGRFDDDPMASSMKFVVSSFAPPDPLDGLDPLAFVLGGLGALAPGGECAGVESISIGSSPSASPSRVRLPRTLPVGLFGLCVGAGGDDEWSKGEGRGAISSTSVASVSFEESVPALSVSSSSSSCDVTSASFASSIAGVTAAVSQNSMFQNSSERRFTTAGA